MRQTRRSRVLLEALQLDDAQLDALMQLAPAMIAGCVDRTSHPTGTGEPSPIRVRARKRRRAMR